MFFKIRRIFDNIPPAEVRAIDQIKDILRAQFDAVADKDIERLPGYLHDPFSANLRYFIHAAEDQMGRIRGFSILSHSPDLNFCFLDYISAAPKMTGSGIGGAIYEQLREECLVLGVIGIFMECLPDDPELCPGLVRENSARLRFYERYGARPIINTSYETPLQPDEPCPPYLVFDDLGQGRPLKLRTAKRIVRAILEIKYGRRCPPGYINMVTSSFTDNPVRLRPPRYRKNLTPQEPSVNGQGPIALLVSDRHQIHHVRERGYVESPVRIKTILERIIPTGLFTRIRPERFGLKHITAVHDSSYVAYFGKVCRQIAPDISVYPYVFPIRNRTRPPIDLPIRAGYYCIDTFTPINNNAYLAARRAVDCAMTGAEAILEGGFRFGYALVRPPGHHAEPSSFGGFCYFNSTAAAAELLSHFGRVAILDTDYHHGNGTQEIFYDRADVLTVSIHGHPRFAYPYFSGFEDETGRGRGLGFNRNYPLPENGIDGEAYRRTLRRALARIAKFKPRYLVIALGLDPAKGDPTGTWLLTAKDFRENGRLIGGLGLPTLVVQEGGYKIRSLGSNARHFFLGLHEGAQAVSAGEG